MSRLDRILAKLPAGYAEPLQHEADAAISISQPNPHFVKPPLREIHQPSGSCPILLISAPGAVGKTTLAGFISAEKQSHLWDLARLSLGSNTFLGTLAKGFGSSKLSDILQLLSAGQVLFVLDAFDEAEIASGGWADIETFLREIYEYVKQAPRTCMIMLARSETASYIRVILDDIEAGSLGVYAMYEIDYFDEEPARQFVGLQMDRVWQLKGKGDAAPHRKHPIPYNDALSRVLTSLQQALSSNSNASWDIPEVRSFLGYAPVLQAVATYLGQSENFKDIDGAVTTSPELGSGTSLVAKLLTDLVQREQNKLIEGLQKQNIAEANSWDKWQTIYNQYEQLRRIFLWTRSDAAATNADKSLPPWLVTPYEAALATMLPQHPFLRERCFTGPAFRDYTLAFLLSEIGANDEVRAFLDEPSCPVSPMLAQFYMHCARGSAPGDLAGYLYESAVARHGIRACPRMILIAPDCHDGTSTAHRLEVFDDLSDGSCLPTTSPADVAFDLLVDRQHPVVFSRQLRHAVLVVRGQLVLGSPHVDFEMTDVEVISDSLTFRSSRVVVRTSGGVGVTLKALQYTQIPAALRVDKLGDGPLSISWPGGDTYPWSRYFVGELHEEPQSVEGALLALRKILTWFRRDKRSDLARYKLLIDNVAVGCSKFRACLRDYLIRERILVESGCLYKLDVQRAQSVGINWRDVRDCKASPALKGFLEGFLATVR